MIELSHMILSIYGFVALNFKSYGTFCILKSSKLLSRILPTTEIIEPKFLGLRMVQGNSYCILVSLVKKHLLVNWLAGNFFI